MNNPNQNSLSGIFRTARECVRYHHQSIWTISATLSLLSARTLLVESNFHYPLLVNLAQLTVTTIAAIAEYQWRRKSRVSDSNGLLERMRLPGMLLGIGEACFTALSMICMLQAVLHFKNLPTLVMLITVAIFADDFTHFLLGVVPKSRRECLRVVLLLLACVGILATEYRLLGSNLKAAIPAMLFAGMARALRRLETQYYPDRTRSRDKEVWWLLGTGYTIAATWVLFFWPDIRLVTMHVRHVPLLAFNAALTTATLLCWISTVLPVEAEESEDSPMNADSKRRHTSDGLYLLTLVGIVGSYSTVSTRRSYTNVFQYCCFSAAVLCITCNTYQDSGNSHKNIREDDPLAYELLDDFSSTDEENLSAVDEPSTRLSSQMIKANRRLDFRSILGGVAVVFLWALYIYNNFATRQFNHPSSGLDHHYKPSVPLEIVISMYKEPVKGVASFISSLEDTPTLSGANVTIYIKDADANADDIRQRTGANRVVKLPNIGREGETYLNHITSQWDSLAKHTLFLQADVHNSREVYTRLQNYFDPERTGFLNLGPSDICNCENCGDQFFWTDNIGLFPEYYSRIYNSSSAACKHVSISYKGQFVASAARIRGIDKAVYHDLRQAFVDEHSWAHQPEFLRGRPDSMSAPHFGYSMERMWNLVFQCEGLEVAWKCPSMTSGWRIGGDVGDCQCFDSGPGEI